MCSKNDEVHQINTLITESIPGTTWQLHLINSIVTDSGPCETLQDMITPELLHGLDSSSISPHLLTLEVGCSVIILWNLSSSDGLCNGAWLIITHLSRFNITGIITNGPFAGNIYHMWCIPHYSSDLDVPFKLRRLQFPIRPAFALTINKSQGQTLQCAGLYLQSPVFSHGQLYVALSRTTTIRTLHVLIKNDD